MEVFFLFDLSYSGFPVLFLLSDFFTDFSPHVVILKVVHPEVFREIFWLRW
jgi:hypothetical protein